MALDQALLARPGYEDGTLWWNLHGVAGYIRDNPGLINYAKRQFNSKRSIDQALANALMLRIQAMTARHGRGAVMLPDLLRVAETVHLHEGGSDTKNHGLAFALTLTGASVRAAWHDYYFFEAMFTTLKESYETSPSGHSKAPVWKARSTKSWPADGD